jgi:hypothetical protein
MAEEFANLTPELLQTDNGVAELQRILRALSNEGKTVLLPYGESSAVVVSSYLNGVDGVAFTASIGYRMHKQGSIIGHSTLANITTATSGDVTFEVRVNDTNKSELENEFASGDGTGVASKNNKAPRFEVPFNEGDIITVRATLTGTMGWTSVIGFVEVQFDDEGE